MDSHIIPNFQIRMLKRSEIRYYEVSTDPNVKDQPKQRGFTERLFCAKCDNVLLQRNEDYFARILKSRPLPNTEKTERLLVIRDHDYKRTKNFLLSVLWRMSISSLGIFQAVSLGEKHEEAIRVRLLFDQEFDESEYPIIITAPFINGRFHSDLILQPDCIREGGNRVYRAVIAGLLYSFVVGSVKIDSELPGLGLTKDALVIIRKDAREISFLSEALHQVGRANAIRDSNQTG